MLGFIVADAEVAVGWAEGAGTSVRVATLSADGGLDEARRNAGSTRLPVEYWDDARVPPPLVLEAQTDTPGKRSKNFDGAEQTMRRVFAKWNRHWQGVHGTRKNVKSR